MFDELEVAIAIFLCGLLSLIIGSVIGGYTMQAAMREEAIQASAGLYDPVTGEFRYGCTLNKP